MTLKYESEILFDLMKRDGDVTPSDVLPYESELKEKYLNQVEGAYPKLQDYRPEWLNYNLNAHLPADFPVESVSNVTNATFENVVPYVYRSAILKGSTKYRDIDTGDILDTFDETKKLELVSVKMPVLTTVGKNLFDKTVFIRDDYKWIDDNGNEIAHETLGYSKNLYYIGIGTFTISGTIGEDIRLFYYDKQGVFKGRSPLFTNTLTFSCDEETYVRIGYRPATLNVDNIQIEQGTQSTFYEPYKTNILTVNEDVELRGIGDVQDELDLLTGELTQRIGEIVLDGSENWLMYGGHFYTNIENINHSTICISNWLMGRTGLISGKDQIGVSLQNGVIRVNLDGVNDNVETLKDRLKQTPLIIQYPLATDSVKTVNLTVTDQDGNTTSIIRPIEGTMHVSTSSQTFPPLLDISVPVEATTQNLMSFANIVEEE